MGHCASTLEAMGRGTNASGTATVPKRSLPVFEWDGHYDNLEQVRPYLEQFEELKRELQEAGHYPYNDSFVGKIDGLADSEREDTGIYLLQRLSREEARQRQLDEARAQGFEDLTARPPSQYEYVGHGGEQRQERFAEIIVSTEHSTQRYRKGRVVFSRKLDGAPWVVMPKGARTRGRLIETGSTVLVLK